MANPLFEMSNNLNRNPQPQPQNGMFQRFQQFLNNFRGNPEQKVRELISSGMMTQEQFAEYSRFADQVIGTKNNRKVN